MGRREQTQQLLQELGRARAGRGTSLAVTGPAGIGKTSLLRWLEEEALRERFRVRHAYCERGLDTPFFAFHQMLPLPPAKPEAAAPAPEGPDFLGALGLTPAPVSREFDAGEGAADPEALKRDDGGGASLPLPLLGGVSDDAPPSLTVLRYRDELIAESAKTPQLLLLDDLQWADPQSLLAFQFLSRSLRGLNVLMAAAVREGEEVPSEPGPEPGVMGLLDQLTREGALRRLKLAPLHRGEVRRQVSNLLGGPVESEESEVALRKLTERSGGVPYFVSELLMQLQQEGGVRKGRKGWNLVLPDSWRTSPTIAEGGPGAPIPATLQRLLRARLSRLNLEDRSLLDAASVLGLRFDLLPLAAVLHRPVPLLETRARRLAGERLLLTAPMTEGDPWTFSHPLLWEFLVRELPGEDQRRLAGTLGAWWEEHRPSDLAQVAALLYLARDLERGPAWVRKALEHARRNGAFEQVERYLRWLRELLMEEGTAPPVMVEEQLLIVDALRAEGAFPACRRILTSLRALPVPGSVLGDIEVRLADVVKVIDPSESRAILGRLETGRVPGVALPTGHFLGRLRVVQAYLHNDRIQYSESIAVTAQALELLGPQGNPYDRARCLTYRSSALANLGRWDEAVACLRDALEVARGAGLMGIMEQAMMSEAAIQGIRGFPGIAHQRLGEVTALARRSGHVPAMIWGLILDFRACLSLGDVDTASQRAEQAETLARQFGLTRFVGMAVSSAAEVAVARGELEKGLRLARRSALLLRGFGPVELLPVRVLIARALAARGDVGEAEEEFRTLVPKDPAVLQQMADLPAIYLCGGEVEEAAGRPEKAREHFLAAVDAAAERGQPLTRVDALLAVAIWEDRHGTPAAALALRDEARTGLKPLGLELESRPAPILPPPRAAASPVGAPATALAPGQSTGDRILLHLSRYPGFEHRLSEGGTVPAEVTQGGIGKALGTPQGRLAAPLQRLVQRGLVASAVCHVQGSGRRIKAYTLTARGTAAVRALSATGPARTK